MERCIIIMAAAPLAPCRLWLPDPPWALGVTLRAKICWPPAPTPAAAAPPPIIMLMGSPLRWVSCEWKLSSWPAT